LPESSSPRKILAQITELNLSSIFMVTGLAAFGKLAIILLIGQMALSGIERADALFGQYHRTEDVAPLKEAVALLSELEKAEPNNYEVLWRRARVYYALGDNTKPTSEKLKLFEQAIASGKHAVEINPDGVEGHYWLGVSYGGYGEAKGAFKAISLVGRIRKEMEAVIRIDPKYEDGGAFIVLGRLDYELPALMGGSKKRAIREYEQGLKVAPSNPLLKVFLAESYIDADRKSEAKQLLEQVLSIKLDSQPSIVLKDAQRQARRLYSEHFASQ
jgi:tetratricopeptide (TPR) repeat protein